MPYAIIIVGDSLDDSIVVSTDDSPMQCLAHALYAGHVGLHIFDDVRNLFKTELTKAIVKCTYSVKNMTHNEPLGINSDGELCLKRQMFFKITEGGKNGK